ncbi:HNH endonuclease [Sorangium sp. So ce1182]|uniref:HNH endonuclease n=1 Tax=Sorangium sp. So ce1182 TaxID=3133334 RepID=UPI003F640E40
MTLTGPSATLLEMAAVNNGFDLDFPHENGWLVFASTQAPLRIWLRPYSLVGSLVAFSQLNVARALGDAGALITEALPQGAHAARAVDDHPALYRLLRRAFQLSKTLPDELLLAFEKKTRALPNTTDAERLAVQRVGQDIFRAGLFDYWDGRCAVTGLAVPELLRASHIKAWAACSSDGERLDVFNGLLLAPQLDAAFDKGFITVADDGEVVVAPVLSAEDRRALGFDSPLRARGLSDGHRGYLRWHRETLFKSVRT